MLIKACGVLGILQSAELWSPVSRLTFAAEVFLSFALLSYKHPPAEGPKHLSCDQTAIVLP